MPERVSSTSARHAAQATVSRAPERAHSRFQEAKTASPDSRKAAVKEVRDSFSFSPDARARANEAASAHPATSNAGIDTSITPQFSERPGVSFGSKG